MQRKGEEKMIKPARGYCLIEPLEAEEVSAGGVVLPERMKDMPQSGRILSIGKESLEMVKTSLIDPIEFSVGNTVIFKRFVDNRIKEEGKELLLVKFEDILGVYG